MIILSLRIDVDIYLRKNFLKIGLKKLSSFFPENYIESDEGLGMKWGSIHFQL